ncbi:acylphosphatase [Chitinophaga barathri]|uniref:acylphosphatase n=1 Tax=Chitinophaga barathri TaxID=1647451 RepID=A0A3N4N1X9_9BACT|nr:acylphosphatase [Chitinophaga barathri]RPD41633.1 acylphosphatase [Chitinophaga barathri]
MIHKEIVVKGKVQGVYFRATARSVAVRLGLTGAVKNLPDGHVWIVAEGPRHAMDEFIDWCRIGPSGAKVSALDITEGPLENISGFEILHS